MKKLQKLTRHQYLPELSSAWNTIFFSRMRKQMFRPDYRGCFGMYAVRSYNYSSFTEASWGYKKWWLREEEL